MKKLVSVFLCSVLLAGVAACGSNESSSQTASFPAEPAEQAGSYSAEAQESSTTEEPESLPAEAAVGKALVVYFSATGNTKAVAEALAELQGADIYEIVPEQPYTDEDLDYQNSASRASVEQNDETARPAISGKLENFEEYDVVYVGFPIWWGEMPRILNTFFDTYDFSGKVLAPFCTSGGSGIATAVQSMAKMEPDATITEGLRVSDPNGKDELIQWLDTIMLAVRE